MAYTECSVRYHRMKVFELPDFAEAILLSYYANNPPFVTHIIPKADFEKLLSDYRKTHAVFTGGGSLHKGDFTNARAALMNGLDEIKDDVNRVANGDEITITLGGFKPVKTYRSAVQKLLAPEIERLTRGISLEILPVCKIVQGAEYYTCIISEGAPLDPRVKISFNKLIIPKDLPTNIQIDESKKRKKSFTNLKHLVTYYVYFFVRNSAGLSPLSEPRSIVCVGEQ